MVLILKALGIAVIVYIIYLLVRGIFNYRKMKQVGYIAKKTDVIEKKVNSIDKKLNKLLKKS